MKKSALQIVALLAISHSFIVAEATPQARTVDQLGPLVARPLRSGDLPADTITVKIVGTGMTDLKVGIRVGLYQSADGQNFMPFAVEATKKDGRAQFAGLKADTTYVVVLEVGGKNVRSDAFKGGAARLLFSLAAAAKGADPHAQGGPAKGAGGMPAGHPPMGQPSGLKSTANLKRTNRPDQMAYLRGSHLLAQLGEKHVSFLQVLNIANRGKDVFDPGPAGFLIPLPNAATRPEIHAKGAEGFFQVTPDKRAIRLVKPFPPGQVRLQVTYSMEHTGGKIAIKQRLTLPIGSSVIAVTNNENVNVEGPSFAEKRMNPNATGTQSTMYVLKPVNPGGTLEVTISDIPHRPLWPIFATFGLTLLILIWGLYGWATGRARAEITVGRREALLNQLVELNKRKKAGRVTEEKFQSKHQNLMTELRQVWNQ
jgi:hypothetical protein